MKNNHPNLHWRRAMRQAGEAFLQSDIGKMLCEQRMITREGIPPVLREVYKLGYEAGRKSMQRSRDDDKTD